MTPRLRSMTMAADKTLLVLDRVADSAEIGPEAMSRFNVLAQQVGAHGGLLFDGPVDLPNDDPVREGLTIHADELAALHWAVDHLSEVSFSYDPGPKLGALRLLIQRAEQ